MSPSGSLSPGRCVVAKGERRIISRKMLRRMRITFEQAAILCAKNHFFGERFTIIRLPSSVGTRSGLPYSSKS